MLIDPVRINRRLRAVARHTVVAGRSPLNAAWRRWELARAVDGTTTAASRSALVVAPHPDDETVGVGALIARKRAAGTAVDVVVVTDGRHGQSSRYVSPAELAALREAETIAACAMLGVEAERLHFLRFEEGTLWRALDTVAAALAKLIAAVDPDEVLVTSHLDWHPDHRAANAATRAAVTSSGREPLLWAYPVSLWGEGPLQTPPWEGAAHHLRGAVRDVGRVLALPRPTAVAAERFEFLKRAALDCYASRRHNLTGETAWSTVTDYQLEVFAGRAEVLFPLGDRETEPPSRAEQHASLAGSTSRSGPAHAPHHGPAIDDFAEAVPPGATIGSVSAGGAQRRGIDAEGVIAVDHGAARLGPLAHPGWGRQSLTYGPFVARPGLTVAVSLLHSHHNAHTDNLYPSRREMLERVLRDFPSGHLLPPEITENLLVGFSEGETVEGVDDGLAAFVVHAAGAVNGEVRARSGGGWPAVHSATREVPLALVVVLHESSALYLAASTADVDGFPAAPRLRPLALGALPAGNLVYGGVHQSVHGETGHRIASRVEAVRVVDVAGWATWPGTSLTADRFAGSGRLAGSLADAGGTWTVLDGGGDRREGSLVASPQGIRAVVAAPEGERREPAGLVHLVARTAAHLSEDTAVGLLWRTSPEGQDGWQLSVSRDHAELFCTNDGHTELVARCRAHLPAASTVHLSLLDDGSELRATLDGRLLFGGPVADRRGSDAAAVGLVATSGAEVVITSFQAHPRVIAAPPELELRPFWAAKGERVVLADSFEGAPGDLAEGPTETEATASPAVATNTAPGASTGVAWRRCLGEGHIERSGAGSARVRASRLQPNCGRTAYVTDWGTPAFADLEVTVTPPGTARSQGHGSRGGLIFWQDDANYALINVWVDDSPNHNGSAISLFVRSDGLEEETDAVWVNVGREVSWGRPSRLRASCDGDHLLVWLDERAVLYRRLTDIAPAADRLAINHVGIVVNREWGDDTGTEFTDFVARA